MVTPMVTPMAPSVHIIHTSGDIEKTFKEDYTKYTKNNKNIGKYDIQTYNPLIKQSDNLSSSCNLIAKNIQDLYDNYDVFIVVCSSDILAYIASSLSFMLENLSKPVVFTSKNILQTLISSSNTKIPEVMVFSQDKLLRACRVTNMGKDVYISPKFRHLDSTNSLQPSSGTLQVKTFNPQLQIVTVNENYLNSVGDNKLDGIIIESNNSALLSQNSLDMITNLIKKGTIVVVITKEQEKLDKRISDVGVIYGGDMIPSACSAKLNFLLSNVEDKKLIGQLMEKSFRGEISNTV